MLTKHAIERMNQRGISEKVIDTVLDWGRSFVSHGQDVYFIPKKMVLKLRDQGLIDIPPERIFGVYVVVGDGCVVTVAHKKSMRFKV